MTGSCLSVAFDAIPRVTHMLTKEMIQLIYVNKLKKDFKKTIKEPGLKGSLKSFVKPKTEIITAVNELN